MTYLLDTNTVSYYLRGLTATVQRIQGQSPSTVAISAITAMELAYGVEKRRSARLTAAVHGFLSGMTVLPFDQHAAQEAGTIRARLEAAGLSLSLADCQIAGHAKVSGRILVSSDKALAHVDGLVVEDWNP